MTHDAQLAAQLAPVPQADPGSSLPATWCDGPFMQVFVRAYQDADGDGIGDLAGLASRLDYLRELGIRGLWLMPVMRSADQDHGYATENYREIEPRYGTLADFDALLAQAHLRGMGVILDYVVNHSAATHPLFLSARTGPCAPFRDWYLWASPRPRGWDIHGHDPWIPDGEHAYFTSFDARMPDFDLRNEEVLQFHLANLRFWLNRGVDGFRFDAVPHFIKNGPHDWKDQPESRRLARRLREQVCRYQHRYVVCESTAKPWIYSLPSVGASAFAFGLNKLILRATAGTVEAVRELADVFLLAPSSLATMMSNHDRITGRRLWDETGGDLARYRLAAATYLLLPGIPFLYYGEEVGMSGAPGLAADDSLRAPMSWVAPGEAGGFTQGQSFRVPAANAATANVAAQMRQPHSLHSFYTTLLGLRGQLPALARGRYEECFCAGSHFGFLRRHEAQSVLVLLHYGDAAETARIEQLPPGTDFESVLAWNGLHAAVPVWRAGAFDVLLPPRSASVYLLHDS